MFSFIRSPFLFYFFKDDSNSANSFSSGLIGLDNDTIVPFIAAILISISSLLNFKSSLK